MKFKVEHSRSSQSWIVVLPESKISIGTTFEVGVGLEGHPCEKKMACLLADGRSLKIENEIIRFQKKVHSRKQNHFRIDMSSEQRLLSARDLHIKMIRPVEPKFSSANSGGGQIKSPMTGKVLQVLVKEGDAVTEDQDVLTIEAMKMENRIKADCSGTLKKLQVAAGQTVVIGDSLFFLEPLQATS